MKLQKRTHLTLVAACVSVFVLAGQATAQTEQIWQPVVIDNWNTGANWAPFAATPDVSFDEVGVIENGGTAYLDAPASTTTGGVILGRADTGALEIRNGGSLVNAAGSNVVGSVLVGNSVSTGTLTVEPGGSLTAVSLSLSNAGSSSVSLGGTTAGTTTVAVDSASLSADTRIIGPNVNFTVTNDLVFGGTNTLTAEITGLSHSAIQVTGNAQLNGTLNVEFNGYVPSVGNSWTLVDAGTVTGGFAPTVTTNATFGPGQTLIVSQTTSGNTLVDVSLEEVLVLKVNRQSGTMSLDNVTATPMALGGYSVQSASGALNPAGGVWNSLTDQAVPGFQEANPSANLLAELNPNIGGSASFPATSSTSLGTPYSQIVPAFGTPITEDLVFTYRREPDGQTVTGLIEYEGDLITNNLLLTVDPTTGNGRIVNDSLTALQLDGYSIGSDSGTLLTSWDSLTDQGGIGWEEANISTTRLSELNPENSMSLGPGASFDLAGLFNTAGSPEQDLIFTFHDATMGMIGGNVVYDAISAYEADFNNDGVVDGDDLTKWEGDYGVNGGSDADGDGESTGNDFLWWQRQLGSGVPLAAAVTSVPEPASITLLTLLAISMLPRVSRK